MNRFSPREFLKSRRPERFSDSVGQDTPLLDRPVLEHHLGTLTNRNEEMRFETFVRRLLERTVCPNLLPHTGPTGGGDSKVDTETFPVAEGLAIGWYMGIGNEAATERWAFAISAMKDWRRKLKSDIAKIISTDRGYTKTFFVSNQYIRDKERAEIEDMLRTKYSLDVRVFDLTWILDRVFAEHLEQLAIDELGLRTSVRREIRKGPLDTEREQSLEKVEARIQDALQNGRKSIGLVHDCLEAAELARELERPRTEVEGLYLRADQMAKQFGTAHQRLRCAYDQAWTAFWWHEDFIRFVELYAKVEEAARGSRNSYELELWTNLFMLLSNTARRGEVRNNAVDVQARAATLIAALQEVEMEKERRSTALHARTLWLLVRLSLVEEEEIDPILCELTDVARDSESLLGYPLEPLVKILMELGRIVGNRSAYDKLFETVVQTASKRQGEVSAARMLLTRGAQQLDADLPYEAISTLGLALGRLHKHESRHSLVEALYLCARAYERVGLLWAARGTMLFAASTATNEFWTYGEVTPQQAVVYSRIKWLELRLGRLPHLLAWHELDRILRSALLDRGYRLRQLSKHDQSFDALLGVLFLRTDFRELRELSPLPAVLEDLDLALAAIALKYALGHEDEVLQGMIEGPANAETTLDLFREWRDQPAADELPSKPMLCIRRTVNLSSNVMGCRIRMDCWNTSPCLELAESTLAAIEGFLATGSLDLIVAREPSLDIKVRPSDFSDAIFTFEARDVEGRPHIDMRCRDFDPNTLSADEQGQLKDQLIRLVANILIRVFEMKNPEGLLERLFRDERVPERALGFTSSFVVVGNALGKRPKNTLLSWTGGVSKLYPVARKEAWDQGDSKRAPEPENAEQLKVDDAVAEAHELVGFQDRPTHQQIRTVSLIRLSLWNEASWCGTAFVISARNSAPPYMGLLFRKFSPADTIFKHWHSELGPRDESNKLRVSIIRGVSKANAFAYRVVLGSNPDSTFAEAGIKRAVTVSRVHTMEPSSNENLMRFLGSYKEWKGYFLTFGVLQDNQVSLAWANQVHKQELIVRDAWEIGPNDIEVVAIREDDDPIVPDGKPDAPVLRVLRNLRQVQ
jgi:hypothetical protein